MTKEIWYSDTENDYKGFKIEIWNHQEHAEDPREWQTPMGHMVCFHNSYDLGDKHEFSDPQEVLDFIKRDDILSIPLYLLDHSGLAMRAGQNFSDVDPGQWDSGRVGYIYMSEREVIKEYGKDPEAKQKAIDYMRGEIKTYSAYLEGDVFGWTLYAPEGEEIDSCGGYYGFDLNIDYVVSEVKAQVDNIIKERDEHAQAILDSIRQHEAQKALAKTMQFHRKG